MHDCTIYLKGEVWAHQAKYTPPFLIEVPAPMINYAGEILAVSTSYTVTNIDKSGKNLLGDREKKKIYVEGK